VQLAQYITTKVVDEAGITLVMFALSIHSRNIALILYSGLSADVVDTSDHDGSCRD
jgi:hypothetical protein